MVDLSFYEKLIKEADIDITPFFNFNEIKKCKVLIHGKKSSLVEVEGYYTWTETKSIKTIDNKTYIPNWIYNQNIKPQYDISL